MTCKLSIEFFPPQGEERVNKLATEIELLASIKPDYYSVTYGAGGSTRENTLRLVKAINQRGFQVAPHLSCVGSSKQQIAEILQNYQEHGIKQIVALRGDLPSGMADQGELRYANQLVEYIRQQTANHFKIIVAAYPEWHPQAKSPAHDLDNFCRKVAAGADSAITQYFYNLDAFLHFRDQVAAKGISIPIIPGIMPINSFSKLARFSDSCGAEIPRWMRLKFESYADDSLSIRQFGIEVVTKLCQQLIENGCDELHFYSMNQASLTKQIWQNLQ